MRLGPSDPDRVVDLQVVLRQPHRAELEAFLGDVADPTSPEFHRYLAPEAFGERFGLPDEAIDSVVAWLETAGLQVVGRDAGRTFLAARGRVADVNALFQIELVDHRDTELGRYRVPDAEPRVPAALQDFVRGIAGLDTTPVIRPMYAPPVFADVPLGGLLPRPTTTRPCTTRASPARARRWPSSPSTRSWTATWRLSMQWPASARRRSSVAPCPRTTNPCLATAAWR
jgi:subtilase family serine protease